ncbi:hypothetical protein [Peptoniphilus timonensis]|nr:hypothetical protein [Peptoniphilus timonensis]
MALFKKKEKIENKPEEPKVPNDLVEKVKEENVNKKSEKEERKKKKRKKE